MRILIDPDRNDRRGCSPDKLRVKDISHLHRDTHRVCQLCIRTKSVYCREFGEVYLRRRFECKIFEEIIFPLGVDLSFESERIKAFHIFPGVFVTDVPGEASNCVGLPIRHRNEPASALIDVPDDLFHHHKVPEVRMT